MENYALGTGDFTPQSPQFVQDVRQGSQTESITVTANIAATGNVKDAAGSTVVIELNRGPILEKYGARIGSYWGSQRNLQYTNPVQSVTETNGSAAFTVSDANTDLEKIFEGVTEARYVAKLVDGAGKEIYGWIGGVSVSGSVYTFNVFSGVGLGTQNWFQGGSTAFDHTAKGSTVYIYKYATSLALGSSDTFTEEVPYHAPGNPQQEGITEAKFLASLTNGQYGVNYKESIVLARKANADDTEDFTYRTFSGGGDTQAHGSAVSNETYMQGLEAKDFDGSALPNTVTEGQTVRQAGTMSGIAYAMFTNEDGSQAFLPIAHDSADSGAPIKIGGRAVDPVALPTAVQANDRCDGFTSLQGEFLVYFSRLFAGEDQANGVMKTEGQFSSSGVLTADTQVKASGGFLHSATFSCNDAAPTAGSVIIYNNTAESGTQVFNQTFTTTPFAAYTLIFNVLMSTGIYVGFTTTADVNVSVSFR